MQYKFEVTKKIYKYIVINAPNEDEALNIAEHQLSEGEIRFDDEPFLKTECNIRMIQ